MACTAKTLASGQTVTQQEILLSRNFESSQLIAPGQLDRITIDNPHFQNLGQETRNFRLKKPKIMGDKYFFLQKDIPVKQFYTQTALKLSNLRPWDRLVDPPLKAEKVVSKELNLAFPQEHPYSSHIPHFTMFPDVQPYKYHATPASQATPTDSNRVGAGAKESPPDPHGSAGGTKVCSVGGTKVHAGTQTPVATTPSGNRPATTPPHCPMSEEGTGVVAPSMDAAYSIASPPLPYYVKQKACESSKFANRVEHRFLYSSAGFPVVQSGKEMMWDYPRSQRHRRSHTYPAPSYQYARLPINPGYLPPPSTNTLAPPLPPSHSPASSEISQNTKLAIDTIHSLVWRSTTYRDHFTPCYSSRLQMNGKPDYSISSRQSQRPWTEESRGKYNHMGANACSPLLSEEEEEESGEESEEESEEEGEWPLPDRARESARGGEPGVFIDGASLVERGDWDKSSNAKMKGRVEETATANGAGAGGGAGGDGKVVVTRENGTQSDNFYFVQQKDAGIPRIPAAASSSQVPPSQQHSVQLQGASSPPTPADDNKPPSRQPIDALTARLYKLPSLQSDQPGHSPGNRKMSTQQMRALADCDDNGCDYVDAKEGVSVAVDAQQAQQQDGTIVGVCQGVDTNPRSPPGKVLTQLSGHMTTGPSLGIHRRGKQLEQEQQQKSSLGQKLHRAQQVKRWVDQRRKGGVADSTPHTVESTRRMMEVFSRFSKSSIIKKFSQQYQEVPPDLRRYSTVGGKRHVIHGHHSYYYH